MIYVKGPGKEGVPAGRVNISAKESTSNCKKLGFRLSSNRNRTLLKAQRQHKNFQDEMPRSQRILNNAVRLSRLPSVSSANTIPVTNATVVAS